MTSKKEQWKKYCEKQLEVVTPILLREGFVLDAEQPHLKGERYILSGPKLVLYGIRKSDNLKVVIKISNDVSVIKEMEYEQKCRETLEDINFAYHAFKSPKEILFGQNSGYYFLITRYIEEDIPFLKRPTKEQFFIALKAFEMQEGLQMVTKGHKKKIEKIFPVFNANKYIETMEKYKNDISKSNTAKKETQTSIENAISILKTNKKAIKLYSDFLTHWDFVPHNIRVDNKEIYILDHSAIRFGNKYESWARFMNFMLLHNTELEKMLEKYTKENFLENEYTSLNTMRLFRLSELIWFYVMKLNIAEDKLLKLTNLRIDFWTKALNVKMEQKDLDKKIIEEYKKERDTLRDKDEKERQEKLY